MTTTVKKTSQGYGYRFADLAEIHKELEAQKITYWQEVRYDADAEADYVWTTLNIKGEDLPARRGSRVIVPSMQSANAAQAQGSALTYARRYSLLTALGWATEDDDAASVEAAQPARSGGGRRLDFDELRKELADLLVEEELEDLWTNKYAKMRLSEKQKQLVVDMFKERKAALAPSGNLMPHLDDEEIGQDVA